MYYQDYMLSFTNALLDHLVMQQQIYDCMREFTLIFKIVKAHIYYKTQRVLGNILTNDGRLSITNKTILLIPDLFKPFRLHVDACRVGKGMTFTDMYTYKVQLKHIHLSMNQ